MKKISETTFLYWLYDQIEKIKSQKDFKNKISNIKQARKTIIEIENKLAYIPESYKTYLEQELKDIKRDLKQNPRYAYIFLSALDILIHNVIKQNNSLYDLPNFSSNFEKNS